jgi:hypothetical protein
VGGSEILQDFGGFSRISRFSLSLSFCLIELNLVAFILSLGKEEKQIIEITLERYKWKADLRGFLSFAT